jgi:SPP1 family predicted phage head-tail adaptor
MAFANSGRLRHYVNVQSLLTNGDFREHEAWLTTASVWAEIKPFRGAKPVEGDQRVPNVTHTVLMRTNEVDITPRNRLTYGDRVFEIGFVNDVDENGHYYELGCTEVV